MGAQKVACHELLRGYKDVLEVQPGYYTECCHPKANRPAGNFGGTSQKAEETMQLMQQDPATKPFIEKFNRMLAELQLANQAHNSAVESANKGDWAGAAKWFQQAVDKDPSQWSSWTDGSVALERAGMYTESARWLMHLISHAP